MKETTKNGKTKRVRYIAADVEERDGKLIRYVTIGNRALKLDRDSSVPVQGPASSPGPSAGALVLEPVTPLPPAAWALGLFLLLASWLRSQFRSAARMLRPGLMVAAASLLLVSCERLSRVLRSATRPHFQSPKSAAIWKTMHLFTLSWLWSTPVAE